MSCQTATPPPPPQGGCHQRTPYDYLHTEIPIDPDERFAFDEVIASPWLVVSNSPETMSGSWPSGSPPRTLYKMASPNTPPGTVRVRVFFWHVNGQRGFPLYFAILVGCAGGCTVANYRRRTFAGRYADIVSPGMCVAEAHLYNLMEDADGATVPADGEVMLWSAVGPSSQRIQGPNGEVGPYSLVCGVHEFDIVGAGGPFTVRTVASRTNDSWGAYADPVQPGDRHVRGWWPHSSVQMAHDGTVFNCLLVGGHPPSGQKSICPENTKEWVDGFPWQGAGPDPHGNANGNEGCYGANLRYQVLTVSPGGPGHLLLGLRARGNPQKYAGAARIVSPELRPERDVPKFPCEQAGEPNAHQNCFDLLEDRTPGYFAMNNVLATSPFEVQIELAKAGAAATPVNLLLSRLNLLADPPAGGG